MLPLPSTTRKPNTIFQAGGHRENRRKIFGRKD
jgi:hypothetical protein